jgi:hypothetical protein
MKIQKITDSSLHWKRALRAAAFSFSFFGNALAIGDPSLPFRTIGMPPD